VISMSAVTSHEWIETTYVFSVDATDSPIDGLDRDHVICVYYRFVSVPRLYKEVSEFVWGSYELRVSRKMEESVQNNF
jgi:hypothetical protein